MLDSGLIKRLNDCGNTIKFNVKGSDLSTFKSGGNIEYLIFPNDLNALIQLISILRTEKISYTVIGNGSNLLISDSGVKDILIKLTKLNRIEFDGESVYANSGAMLWNLTKKACENNLSGLEWAIGIPGTIGGAIAMNAGAYGGEIKDCIESVDVIEDGIIKNLDNTAMRFCYRGSIINEKDILILGAKFRLHKDNLNTINERLEMNIDKRLKTQPKQPSVGSVFKRKNNISAALYIDRLGLKGLTVGGAQVSEKHSGFIINTGNATTEDYLMLASSLQQKIFENFGLRFETEIKYLGEENEIVRRLSHTY